MNYDLWGWPQWIYISLWSINLLAAACMDGKPLEGKWNFKARLVVACFFLFTLYSGGFFK